MRGAVKRRRRSNRCRRPERPARRALWTQVVAAPSPPRPPRSPRLPHSRRAFRPCAPLTSVRPAPTLRCPEREGFVGPPRGETPGTARGCGAPRRGTPGPRGALEPRGEEPGSPGCTRRALRPRAPASGHSGAGRRARGDREPVAGVPPAECAAQRAVQRERGRERTGARTRPGCSRLLRKGLRGRRALHLEPPVAGGFAQKENAVTGVKRKLNLQEADLPRPSGSPAAGVASFPPRARVPSWASRRSRGGGFRRAGYTWGAVLRGSPACQGPGLIVLPHPNS